MFIKALSPSETKQRPQIPSLPRVYLPRTGRSRQNWRDQGSTRENSQGSHHARRFSMLSLARIITDSPAPGSYTSPTRSPDA